MALGATIFGLVVGTYASLAAGLQDPHHLADLPLSAQSGRAGGAREHQAPRGARRARAFGTLTLVYGARDEEHNQARVIAGELERLMAG